MKPIVRVVIAIAISVIFLLSGYVLYLENGRQTVSLQVNNGVMDLTGWDFENKGYVALNGYWEFYWDRLLEPSDFSPGVPEESLKPTGFIKVPSEWEGVVNNTRISSKGVGTYRIRIKMDPAYAMYGIKTTSIRMASKLYINGRLAGGSGRPAAQQEASITENKPYTVFFPSEKEYLDVVIQVSDFDYMSGGIVQPVYFGREKAISRLTLQRGMVDLVSVTTLIMTSLYFAGIFVFRKKERALLYFSIYCIAFAFFISTHHEKVLLQLIPTLDFIAVIRVKASMLFVCLAFVYLFIHEWGEQFLPGRIMKCCIWLYSVFCLAILTAPFSVYAEFEAVVHIAAYAFNLAVMFYILKALIARQYGSLGKTGVQLLCLSCGFLVFHSASGMLYNSTLLHDNTISHLALLLHVFTISLFISKRHSDAYNSVEALSESLIRMDKTKDEFLLTTSHELKTPLHGIINITQSILDSSDNRSASHTDDLNYVITIAKRLSSLIQDIIDFQSMKSNTLRLNTRILDINGPVRVVLEVFQRMYHSKRISLMNHVPANTYFVVADENRVRQILYNLVGNALKFTEQGEVRIEAAVRDSIVLISVSDTGIGIRKELQEMIFEHHKHWAESRLEEYPSAGLGLPIARQLAAHMKGKLWLEESEPGKGSKFCFTLPAAEIGVTASIQETAATGDVFGSGLSSGSSVREAASVKGDFSILVVDDEIANVKVMKDIFAGENCVIFTAYNGQQALDAVKANRSISLVLMDVMMPGMSGFEACRRLREEHTLFDLPILLLTVKNSPEDIAAGLDAGANDFLSKPFDARELRARVRTILKLKQSVRNAIQAQTAFLQSQIKPHFIFNALSVITSQCYMDGRKAGELLEEFGNYLRCSFDFNPYASFIDLEKELSMVRSYVEIEKARFGERLSVEYHIDEDMLESTVPALILQPLVENAIRHGVMKRIDGGSIVIEARLVGHWMEMTVKDNGVGIPDEKRLSLLDSSKEAKGVGVRNIHQRLLNLYGEGLHIKSLSGEGTTVSFRIPYGITPDSAGEGIQGGVQND